MIVRLSSLTRMAAFVAVASAFSATSGGRATAEADGPDYFRVTGVEANDVLNIRADAGASHPKIGEIPHDADGIRNLGCIGGLSFAEWEKASDAEREAARNTRWCRIEYGGTEGWVAARFLAEGAAPAPAARGSKWRITEIDGALAAPGAELGFEPDGSFWGSVGCNRFMGSARIDGQRLVADGPMGVTMMACADPLIDGQERRVLALLEEGAPLAYDPVTDGMALLQADGTVAVRLERQAD
ncbi:META domain-containing protein [Limibaculum sp. FT325]|uniref:META domain-containing protein n=1 Tax=Thermohalobaculum sediminis TaxID=2939436 RepID=UPI0020BFAC1E|nr:META domain-containing protein [Limibaculum sediminis]MCL5779335.1 META domain-containing protein [Limibaculum sediminis]